MPLIQKNSILSTFPTHRDSFVDFRLVSSLKTATISQNPLLSSMLMLTVTK